VRSPAGEHEVLVSSCVGTVDAVEVAMTTFVDVTDRNRAQRGAREIEGRMRELVENIAEVTWLTDPENTEMLYISPSYEKVFGRSTAALYADARNWLLAVHPEDRPAMAAWTRPERGMGEGKYRIVRPDGTERSIEFRVFPVADATGTVVRCAGVATDVTDRLVLEEQLRQTQKLESIGLLAGGVAHDFNNVLAVISGNLGLLAESIPATGMDHELVEEIDAAVTRATGLTRQLLAFSRKQAVEPIVINLNDAVKDTRKMLRRMVGEDVVITTSLDPELAAMKIDPGYLVQVLMNLAVNARDAMPRGGTFALTTRNVPATHEVMLEVSDTGTGMSAQVRARVFEPFFTTKDLGRGTGLGLSVVHGIIEQAGGRIELDSVLGSGTTFRFFFPATDQPVEIKRDLARLAPAGTEKILVVDDDAFVRNAAARSLRARGYTVVEARDAFDAMARLREHTGISLLVTDVIMPGLDGGELARLARAECPKLKVLFISGYTDDALVDHGVRPTDGSFLEKPYGTHALAGKVREVIDAH
jgi:PAS domain S-box-containing protein